VRTPFLAAKYADEYNVAFRSVEDTATAYQRARRACVSLDRDPDTLVLSATLLACAGTTAAEVALRAHAMGRDLTVLRTIGLAGTPGELRERVAAYQAIGTRCVYIRILDMSDLGHLQLLASSLLKPGC
jgi:alkanesulfonate monooxygenase SsuD/methylene tetrahydromethanopterin reductase-like flavin-dependent oxidoreductase (luciferase family)